MTEDGSKDHQTKYQAANWLLRDGRLYRKAESKGGRSDISLRRHLDVDEVWDVLTAEHLRSEHLGRDRLRKALEKRFIGYVHCWISSLVIPDRRSMLANAALYTFRKTC